VLLGAVRRRAFGGSIKTYVGVLLGESRETEQTNIHTRYNIFSGDSAGIGLGVRPRIKDVTA